MPHAAGSGPGFPRPGASNPFIARLESLTALTRDELEAMGRLCGPPREVRADREIIPAGPAPHHLHVLLSGWAGRAKQLPDGGRQFSALMVPGDPLDIDALEIGVLDFGVVALEPCLVATIPHDALRALAAERPRVARTLTWLACAENVVMSEWISWQGRRSAAERLANLLCELQLRLSVVGLTDERGFRLPLTQEKLADALGLTPVHVNRTLRDLRERGLADVHAQRVTIPDLDALRRAGGFSPRYLQIAAREREGEAA